ncbi:MAG: ABC transporter ATP-binding protein [Planctomycetes bacterium]|nr:ABC transporter ATP-binding protein [Planctomycetota bacterium]
MVELSAKKPWQHYARLLRPEAADLRTIVVYGVASALLTLAVPLTVDALISNITFGTLLTPLVVLVWVLLGCLVLHNSLRALQAYIAEIVERRIFTRIVGDLAWRLPRVDIRAFDRRYGPELVNRFFDTVTVQKSSTKLVLDATNFVLTTGVGMVVLAFYHPLLLGFSIALLIALIFVVFVMGFGGVRTAVEESSAKYEVAAWLQELARHTTAFCTQGGATFAIERADRLAGDYIAARKRHFRILFRQMLGSFGLQVVASTAMLGFGGFLVIDQQLTPGQLVASELIVTAVVANVTKLGSVLQSWYDVCASSAKLGSLIDLPLERQGGEVLPSATNELGMKIEIASVSCGIVDENGEDRPLTLTMEAGERVSLSGSPGGRASLLLDILAGLREASCGYVMLDGYDLRQLRLEAVRDGIALVHGTEIVEGSVIDNIRFGRANVDIESVRRALVDVRLWDEIMALPKGIETELTARFAPLTASQASRLMLARAIVGRPRLLLLDGALDRLSPSMRSRVLETLLSPERRWTLLVVTAHPDVLAACSRTIELEVGDDHE